MMKGTTNTVPLHLATMSHMSPEVRAKRIKNVRFAILSPEEHQLFPKIVQGQHIPGLNLIPVGDLKPPDRIRMKRVLPFNHRLALL